MGRGNKTHRRQMINPLWPEFGQYSCDFVWIPEVAGSDVNFLAIMMNVFDLLGISNQPDYFLTLGN